jgi:WASH complex subunit strumpellin
MNEIAEYFSGNRNWGKANIDENYASWFRNVTDMIQGLDFKHSTKTGRKIQQLFQALEDVQVYDEIEKSVQIKYYIGETQKLLQHMVRITGVKRQVLVNISYISDFAYGWLAIDDYLPIIQDEIRKDPKVVLYLRTVFMKIASIMNQPLVRIIEANSDDLKSVANFYSSELVRFVKRVLQVIPKKIFTLLEKIS